MPRSFHFFTPFLIFRSLPGQRVQLKIAVESCVEIGTRSPLRDEVQVVLARTVRLNMASLYAIFMPNRRLAPVTNHAFAIIVLQLRRTM
jgi:hypothetical protein